MQPHFSASVVSPASASLVLPTPDRLSPLPAPMPVAADLPRPTFVTDSDALGLTNSHTASQNQPLVLSRSLTPNTMYHMPSPQACHTQSAFLVSSVPEANPAIHDFTASSTLLNSHYARPAVVRPRELYGTSAVPRYLHALLMLTSACACTTIVQSLPQVLYRHISGNPEAIPPQRT